MKQKIQGCNHRWEELNPNYSSMDSSPQTFFYTLSNMLKLDQANHILEIGCGAGKLLSTVLDLKKPETTYLATDLSEAMVNQAKKRLRVHFQKYQSKISFQQWLIKQKLSFDIQDGQNVQIKEQMKFDRIIANMVLCHANDPEKMLKNWNSIATQDCLIGISLLGDPAKNHLVRGIRQSIEEVGQKLPETRPPYYWFDKISGIAQATGWQIILEWEQNSIFPYLQYSETTHHHPLNHMINNRVPQAARDNFRKRILKMMNEDKVGIQAWSKVIIAKKRQITK